MKRFVTFLFVFLMGGMIFFAINYYTGEPETIKIIEKPEAAPVQHPGRLIGDQLQQAGFGRGLPSVDRTEGGEATPLRFVAMSEAPDAVTDDPPDIASEALVDEADQKIESQLPELREVGGGQFPTIGSAAHRRVAQPS